MTYGLTGMISSRQDVGRLVFPEKARSITESPRVRGGIPLYGVKLRSLASSCTSWPFLVLITSSIACSAAVYPAAYYSYYHQHPLRIKIAGWCLLIAPPNFFQPSGDSATASSCNWTKDGNVLCRSRSSSCGHRRPRPWLVLRLHNCWWLDTVPGSMVVWYPLTNQ